jgi:hypothetical protein
MTMNKTTSNFIQQCRAMLNELERVHNESTTAEEYYAARYVAMVPFKMHDDLAELTFG